MAQLVSAPIGVDEANSAYKAISQPFSNAFGKYASNTDSYAEWSMVTGGSAYTYILWIFDVSSIPSNATIDKVTCTARCYNSNTQAFYAGNTSVHLLVGTTSKVITSGIKAFGNTPVEVTLTSTDYTREELDSFRLKIQSTRGYLGTNNTYYTRLYGATLTVEYTTPVGEQFMLKTGGVWTTVSKVYKKINGIWVEQTDLASLFDTNIKYRKMSIPTDALLDENSNILYDENGNIITG